MFWRLFSFRGFASRQEYWLIQFSPWLISLAALIILMVLGAGTAILDFANVNPLESWNWHQFPELAVSSAAFILLSAWFLLMISTVWWSFAVFARRSRSAGLSPNWTWVYLAMWLLSALLLPLLIVCAMWVVWGCLAPKQTEQQAPINRIEPDISDPQKE